MDSALRDRWVTPWGCWFWPRGLDTWLVITGRRRAGRVTVAMRSADLAQALPRASLLLLGVALRFRLLALRHSAA